MALAPPADRGIDLDSAIKAHAQWRAKLRTAAQKREHLDADTVGRDDCCELGKWLHGRGQASYGSVPGFQALVDRHREFHREAGAIAVAINRGHYAQAEQALGGNTAFSRACNEVGAAIVTLRNNL